MKNQCYKIVVYIPTSHIEKVKMAMFKAGAGRLGSYSLCAWQVLGEGQFMPSTSSRAFIGKSDQLEKVAEYRVEMLCKRNCINEVVNALRSAHPYEEPAYDITEVITGGELTNNGEKI